jgi:hypothetical protein
MKRILLTAVLILFTIATSAQDGSGSFGINIKVYNPKSDFNRNVDKTPVGMSINYLRTYKSSKLSWGAEFGTAMYSSDEYTMEYAGRDITIYEEDCFFTFHGFARYNLYQRKGLKVYGEGRIGVTTFFSTTDAVIEDTGYEGEFDLHGSAFNLGLGTGILFNTSTLFQPDNEPGNIWINLGFNGHSGTKATYRLLPEGSATHSFEDGQYESLTHYFGFKAGVSFGIL